MPEPKPTVGRIVHYTEDYGEGPFCKAAIVTSVAEVNETVSITVFHDDRSPTLERKVKHHALKSAFTWHWPEREGEHA